MLVGDQTVPAEQVWVMEGRPQEVFCALIIPILEVTVTQKTKTSLCCYMLDIGAMCSMCDMCVHIHEYEQGSRSTVAYNMRQ